MLQSPTLLVDYTHEIHIKSHLCLIFVKQSQVPMVGWTLQFPSVAGKIPIHLLVTSPCLRLYPPSPGHKILHGQRRIATKALTTPAVSRSCVSCRENCGFCHGDRFFTMVLQNGVAMIYPTRNMELIYPAW